MSFKEYLNEQTQLDEAGPKIGRRFDLTLIDRRTTVEELKAHIEKTGEMIPYLLKSYNREIKGDRIGQVTVFPKGAPNEIICITERQKHLGPILVGRVAKNVEYVFGFKPLSTETELIKNKGFYVNFPDDYVTKATYSASDVKKIKAQTKIVTDMIKEIK
jgi:hypothetical protein